MPVSKKTPSTSSRLAGMADATMGNPIAIYSRSELEDPSLFDVSTPMSAAAKKGRTSDWVPANLTDSLNPLCRARSSRGARKGPSPTSRNLASGSAPTNIAAASTKVEVSFTGVKLATETATRLESGRPRRFRIEDFSSSVAGENLSTSRALERISICSAGTDSADVNDSNAALELHCQESTCLLIIFKARRSTRVIQCPALRRETTTMGTRANFAAATP